MYDVNNSVALMTRLERQAMRAGDFKRHQVLFLIPHTLHTLHTRTAETYLIT
jgi:hypothetical protein